MWPQANTEVVHQNSALLRATRTVLAQKLIGWKKPNPLRISLVSYRNAPHIVLRENVAQLQDMIKREINTDKWGKSERASYLRN